MYTGYFVLTHLSRYICKVNFAGTYYLCINCVLLIIVSAWC